MGSLGETLRQARLDRGLTLDDVANETHIRRRYLESLENEDYGALPAQVYTRGFIRTYARFLGLDPEMAVDLYLPWRAREVRVPLRAATPHLSSAGPLQLRIFLAIGGGLLLLFLVAYLWAQYNAFLESTSTVEPVSRTAVPGAKPSLVSSPQTAAGPAILTPSVLVPPRVPSPTPERGIVLELRTTERTWMEIWVDGNQQLQTTLPAGSTRSYTANTEIRMRLGNAGAVQATINGEAQGSLGERNQVKEIVWER